MRSFRIQDWHICLLILFFFFLTEVLGSARIKKMPFSDPVVAGELDCAHWEEDIKQGLNFIFFYEDNCAVCNRMNFVFDQVSINNPSKAAFHKVNVSKNEELALKYAISGTPCVLIFRDGNESARIFGLVSLRNFQLIYDRHAKKESDN